MAVDAGRKLGGLIQKPDGHIDLVRKIVERRGERRAAVMAEPALDPRIDRDRRAEGRIEDGLARREGGKSRDRCTGDAPAVGTMAVGDELRADIGMDPDPTTVASTGNGG